MRCSTLGGMLGGAVIALTCAGHSTAAGADVDLKPGMALPPDQPPAEAVHYEALLQGRDPELLPDDDSVVRRRQFDDRLLHIGAGLNVAATFLVASVFVELSVWDRLALGAEASSSFWGPGAGLHVRGRPIVWGGRRGRRVIHAVTLQGQYRYTSYGEPFFNDILSSMCHADCDRPQFIDMPVHFGVLEVGFEHAFAAGLTLRYASGAAFQLNRPDWRCHTARTPVPCGDEAPPPTSLFVASVNASYAIF